MDLNFQYEISFLVSVPLPLGGGGAREGEPQITKKQKPQLLKS